MRKFVKSLSQIGLLVSAQVDARRPIYHVLTANVGECHAQLAVVALSLHLRLRDVGKDLDKMVIDVLHRA